MAPPDWRQIAVLDEGALPIKVRRALDRGGIRTLGEAADRHDMELMRLNNFGKGSLQALRKHLSFLGLKRQPEVEARTPEQAMRAATLAMRQTNGVMAALVTEVREQRLWTPRWVEPRIDELLAANNREVERRRVAERGLAAIKAAAWDAELALREAEGVFRRYAEHHAAKGTAEGDEKAVANARMARVMAEAISLLVGPAP